MSRIITVKVIDGNGYGLSGYSVNAYGGDKVKTNSSGVASIDLDSGDVTIYVNGTTVYSGSANRCDNPLIVRR